MGIAGGLLYVLHGSWAYTLVLDRSVGAMMTGSTPNPVLVTISDRLESLHVTPANAGIPLFSLLSR
jgi:hypothetical protein